MWKEVLIPVDNSELSDQAIAIGIAISKHCKAKVVGMHAYDMSIHKKRFKVLMPHLQDEYQQREKREDLNVRHNDIMGLSFTQISASMIKVVEEKAAQENVAYEGKVFRGKHADTICDYTKSSPTDLIVLGATGQGNSRKTGGCAKKVLRRIHDRDMLFVKNNETNGKVVVGIDGSRDSYTAMKRAINLAKCFDSKLVAVSIFDLKLHDVVFNSMKHVMEGEADQVFNSEKQEELHEQVIHSGIRKVYLENAEVAKKIAEEEGVEIETIVEPGRAEEKIVEIAIKENASFIVFSRLGLHKTEKSDIGSIAEALFAESPCSLLCCAETNTGH